MAAQAAAPAEIKAAALKRLNARRAPKEFRTVLGPLGEMRLEVDRPEFKPSTTLSEWADDQLARLPLADAQFEVLCVILEAARTSGVRAAAAAVAAACKLSPSDQWALWLNLGGLPDRMPEAARLLREVRAEFERLGLQASPPRMLGFPPDPVNHNKPQPSKVEYATPYGQPAGIPSWLR